MLQSKSFSLAVALTAAIVFAAMHAASAAVIEADSFSSTGFTVSSTDLINGVLPTSISGTTDQESLGSDTTGAALTNGAFGPPGIVTAPNSQMTIFNTNGSVVYDFPTSTIGEIDTYSGWRDSGRSQQNYTVSTSTNGGATWSTLFTVNSGNASTSPADVKVALTSSNGVLAAGVDAIMFSFPGASNGVQNGYVGYREIDVIKYTPEPSSLVLCGLGAIGLLLAARRRRSSIVRMVVVCALVATIGSSARATVIGAGPNNSSTSVDNSGTRINVDTASAVLLPAGTYDVTKFAFTVGEVGNAQPFLAVVASGTPGSNAIYDPIAVGTNVDISSFSSVVTSTTTFGGSNTFTLATPTEVYAGFTNISGGPNPVGFSDNGSGTKDDHSNPAQTVIVGTNLTGFSNYGLTREYAFSVSLHYTPEPSSFVLCGLGVIGLLLAARRRRKA